MKKLVQRTGELLGRALEELLRHQVRPWRGLLAASLFRLFSPGMSNLAGRATYTYEGWG